MNLSTFKKHLDKSTTVQFKLENGIEVPNHFHVTEIGLITKKFIDCGGTMRDEKVINFQLWTSTDYDHRLSVSKLKAIIASSEEILGLEDFPIEVEFQQETIGKFDLEAEIGVFILKNKQTACLAEDACGIPTEKVKVPLQDIPNNTCTPGGGCC